MVCTWCLRARASVTIGKNANSQYGDGNGRFFRGAGLQACGVRWVSSTRGDWKWAEDGWEVLGEHSSNTLTSEGRKATGVLGQDTKDSRRGSKKKRPVETPDTNRCHSRGQRARRARTRAWPLVRAGQGPGNEGLSQPSTPPTMADGEDQGQAPLLPEDRN